MAFSNQQSYIAAISARFVQLQHNDIDKRVEVKPYVLDDQMCDECQGQRCSGKFAPFFCANVTCLQVSLYFSFSFPFKTLKITISSSVLLRALLGNNPFTSWTRISQAIGKRRSWSSSRSTFSLVLSSTAAAKYLSSSPSFHHSSYTHKTLPAWITSNDAWFSPSKGHHPTNNLYQCEVLRGDTYFYS